MRLGLSLIEWSKRIFSLCVTLRVIIIMLQTRCPRTRVQIRF